MKKTRVIFGIMALAATLWSCGYESTPAQKDDGIKAPVENNAAPADTRVEITLVGKSNTETQKAYLADGLGNVNFGKGEQISVFDGTYNNAFSAKEDGAVTDFEGMANLTDTYYILSPYQQTAQYQGCKILATVPGTQKAIENTFDPEACLAVAECRNNAFSVINIGAIAKVETTEPFAKIIMKTAKGESIAGSVSIDPATAAVEITSGKSEIEIVPGSGSEIKAGVYYISVLPAMLTEGLKFEFVSADNTTKTKTFSKNINIRQSKGINFGAIKNYDASPMTLAKAKTPAEVFEAMGLGWNLGNQFDASAIPENEYWYPSETVWGNPITTQELFNKLKEAGVKTVRIPVTWFSRSTWETLTQGCPNYVIREEFLKRVHEVITYCKNAGLNAIVNIHHDGSASNPNDGPENWLNIVKALNDPTADANIKTQIANFWTQIANELKDEGDYLIFEGFNEIHDGGWGWAGNKNDGGKQYRKLEEWNQLFVTTVRNTGGNNANRWLSVPGYVTDPDLTAENLILPTDPKNRIMVAIHYYQPTSFSLNLEQVVWGEASGNGKESDVDNTMQKMYNKFVANGIPVYVGEIGCTNRGSDTDQKYREYYLEYCCRVLHNFSMAPVLWDNGKADKNDNGGYNECHGYFHHASGEWMNQYSKRTIDVMKLAVESTDPSYTPNYIKNYKNPAKGY